jgi:hypothetical protein
VLREAIFAARLEIGIGGGTDRHPYFPAGPPTGVGVSRTKAVLVDAKRRRQSVRSTLA